MHLLTCDQESNNMRKSKRVLDMHNKDHMVQEDT